MLTDSPDQGTSSLPESSAPTSSDGHTASPMQQMKSSSEPALGFPTIRIHQDDGQSRQTSGDTESEVPPAVSSSMITSSTTLTSSDKLSALPSPSTPNIHGRGRTSSHSGRPDITSGSLPSFDSLGRGRLRDNASQRGQETPRGGRVSFESDRGTPSSAQRQSLPRNSQRASDPVHPSPSLRAAAHAIADSFHSHSSPRRNESADNNNNSQSPHSPRSHSPLRFFQWSGLNRVHSHPEDPFVPVDPFQLRTRLRQFKATYSLDSSSLGALEPDCGCAPAVWCGCTCAGPWRHFLLDTLPRQTYLHALLRFPSLYFSRVARLFEDAEVSRPDIQRMIDACGDASGSGGLPYPEEWRPPVVSAALVRFKVSWEDFIDSVLREWKTLNVVSALLLSAILTMFQIPSAASDPVTRTAALGSLVCALMSLCYGCIYLIRFSTMRSMYKASQWAEEARKTNTVIWWNVWILLAMPGVWLAWAMILFITAIISFVWRTGSTSDPDERESLPPTGALGPRIAITFIFVLGLIYFLLIVKTLKRYGTAMNKREREAAHALGIRIGSRDGERVASEEARRGRARERGRGRGARPSPRQLERELEQERASEQRERGADLDLDAAVEQERARESHRLRALTGLGLTDVGVVENGTAIAVVPPSDLEKGEAYTTVTTVEKPKR